MKGGMVNNDDKAVHLSIIRDIGKMQKKVLCSLSEVREVLSTQITPIYPRV
jgi:hypothetical protein